MDHKTRLLLCGLLLAYRSTEAVSTEDAHLAAYSSYPSVADDGSEAPTLEDETLDGQDNINTYVYSDPVDTISPMIDLLVPELWAAADQELLRVNLLSPTQRRYLSALPSLLPRLNTNCACERRSCSCCLRVAMGPSQANQTGCVTLAYVRERLAVAIRAELNNRTLLERDIISGSNPPPFCFPIPQAPIITVCLRLANITLTEDARLQVCSSAEAGFAFTAPLIRVRFGCLVVGPGGASWGREPVSNSLTFPAADDTNAAIQELAAGLNSPNNDTSQFLLLQSILQQPSRLSMARLSRLG